MMVGQYLDPPLAGTYVLPNVVKMHHQPVRYAAEQRPLQGPIYPISAQRQRRSTVCRSAGAAYLPSSSAQCFRRPQPAQGRQKQRPSHRLSALVDKSSDDVTARDDSSDAAVAEPSPVSATNSSPASVDDTPPAPSIRLTPQEQSKRAMVAFQHHMHWQNYSAALGAFGQLVPLWFISLFVGTASRLRPLLPPFLDHKFKVSTLKQVSALSFLSSFSFFHLCYQPFSRFPSYDNVPRTKQLSETTTSCTELEVEQELYRNLPGIQGLRPRVDAIGGVMKF